MVIQFFLVALLLTASYGQDIDDVDDNLPSTSRPTRGHRINFTSSSAPEDEPVFVACCRQKLDQWLPERAYLKNENGGQYQVKGQWSQSRCTGRSWDVNMLTISASIYNQLVKNCKAQGYDTAQPWKGPNGQIEGSQDDWHPFLVDGVVTDHYWYQMNENKYLRCPSAPIEKCGINGTWFVACGKQTPGSSQPQRQWLKAENGHPVTVSGENLHIQCNTRGWSVWMARIEEKDYKSLVSQCQKIGYQTAQPTGATKDWSEEGWHPFQVGDEIMAHFWYRWFLGPYEYSMNVPLEQCNQTKDGNFPATQLPAQRATLVDDIDEIDEVTASPSPRTTGGSTPKDEINEYGIMCGKMARNKMTLYWEVLTDANGYNATIFGPEEKKDCPSRGYPAWVTSVSADKYADFVKQCQSKGYKTAQPISQLHGDRWYGFAVGSEIGDHYWRDDDHQFKRTLMMPLSKC